MSVLDGDSPGGMAELRGKATKSGSGRRQEGFVEEVMSGTGLRLSRTSAERRPPGLRGAGGEPAGGRPVVGEGAGRSFAHCPWLSRRALDGF